MPSCTAGPARPAAVRLRPFCPVFRVPGPLPGSQGDGRRPAAPSPRGRARKDASRLPQQSLYGHGATSPAGPRRWLLPSPCDSPERLCSCCPGACPERGSHSGRGLRVLTAPVNRPVCTFLPTPPSPRCTIPSSTLKLETLVTAPRLLGLSVLCQTPGSWFDSGASGLHGFDLDVKLQCRLPQSL